MKQVTPTADVEKEFGKRPKWLQDAAHRLLSKGALDEKDVHELTSLCRSETGIVAGDGKEPVFNTIPGGSLNIPEASVTLRLESIADVKGVNALAPKKPLVFGSKSLTIIFGPNGSGKSGYMRILKHACGAKSSTMIYGNVFEAIAPEQSCKITYTANGTSKEASWSRTSGAIVELKGIPLYDTACAELYINKENEVTFEPALLRLFRLLVEACGEIDKTLQAEIANKVSSLPALPVDYASTEIGGWFSKISHTTPTAIIDANCDWSPENEAELLTLTQRVSEASPSEKAKALRKTKAYVDQLAGTLEASKTQLSNEGFLSLVSAKASAKSKREAATTDAKKVFENSLEGIGSESWKSLWEKARLFSEKYAYKGQPFPFVGTDSRCVLCQQELDVSTQGRFAGFEKFVKGELEADAAKAEKLIETIEKGLTDAPVEKELGKMFDLAGIEDAGMRDEVRVFFQAVTNRKEKFVSGLNVEELPLLPVSDLTPRLSERGNSLEKQALALDQDAKTDQKAALKKKLTEANGRKWLSQQKAAIVADVKRLSAIQLLEEARRKTHTKWLSDTKSRLAELLITEAFVKRFEQELKLLRADKIKVFIEKTKAPKGQVFHQIRIKNAKQAVKTADVLSEGQFRIVSIAAFLADVESKAGDTAFVFDDPISSLDQDYEEATADRLVALSKTRQVIVFTHRLSMLSLLRDSADKAKIEPVSIAIRQADWGAGEPDEILLSAQAPDKAINFLLNDRLKKAREALATQSRADYDVFAKALCSDIRIVLERIIEKNLLSGIVERFRRGIQTLNKLRELAKINADDCKMIDDFMTKYSFYEHSQPAESPKPLPEPDEIETDLKKIASWLEEFKKRAAPTAS